MFPASLVLLCPSCAKETIHWYYGRFKDHEIWECDVCGHQILRG